MYVPALGAGADDQTPHLQAALDLTLDERQLAQEHSVGLAPRVSWLPAGVK